VLKARTWKPWRKRLAYVRQPLIFTMNI